ncbi:MAG TPA: response regulator [Sphingobacteriaceae bacterium]
MKPISILLVEDNEGDVLLTTDALYEGKISNTIAVVRDGWQAIQFLKKNDPYTTAITPDLVLLDVNLPKMNGHEVLKVIKSSEELKHIPVIMLTTSSSESDIMKSYQNYVNCYITKPVDTEDFMKVISSIEDFWISIVQLPKQK